MKRKGYTLIEIGIVVVVVAIIVAFAMPQNDTKEKEEARLAGENFETDVAFARSKSITDPSDPVVIKVDAANNKYWLAKASSPDTPIKHPSTKTDYVVQFGTGGKKGFEHVQIVGGDFNGDSVVQFDGTGGLDQPTPAILQLTSSNTDYEVQVSPAAGSADVTAGFKTDLSLTLPGTPPKSGAAAAAASGQNAQSTMQQIQ